MSDTGHDLHSEFPDDGTVLHRLKTESAHFRTLAERYHLLNKDIVRIETGLEAASDARLEDLKKERLSLLDAVAALVAESKVA